MILGYDYRRTVLFFKQSYTRLHTWSDCPVAHLRTLDAFLVDVNGQGHGRTCFGWRAAEICPHFAAGRIPPSSETQQWWSRMESVRKVCKDYHPQSPAFKTHQNSVLKHTKGLQMLHAAARLHLEATSRQDDARVSTERERERDRLWRFSKIFMVLPNSSNSYFQHAWTSTAFCLSRQDYLLVNP